MLDRTRRMARRRSLVVLDEASQINDDVANRLRAANEKVAVGGLFEWLRSVDDRPDNQTAFTVVTNTGAARPPDRNVARLGQL
jgi:hypothetical protein